MKILKHIFLLIFLASVTSATAQVGQRRKDFSVGISAGYTLNSVSFTPAIKQKMKGSPGFGFSTRYICEKYFNSICGIQAEVNYQNLGWKEKIEDYPSYGVTGYEYRRDLHCIEVPFLMEMGWGKERKGLKFLLMAGPYLQCFFGSKHNANFDLNNPGKRPNNVTYQYTHDLDNKLCYGIEAGIGVELSTGIGHFIVDGRYCYGLGDMYDSSKKGYFARSANGTIAIKLTYLFDIIKTNLDK